MVVRQVLSGSLHDFPVASFSWPARLRLIEWHEVVCERHLPAHVAEKLDNAVISVARKDVPGAVVALSSVLRTSSGSCTLCGILKRGTPCHFAESFGNDQDDGISLRNLLQRTE